MQARSARYFKRKKTLRILQNAAVGCVQDTILLMRGIAIQQQHIHRNYPKPPTYPIGGVQHLGCVVIGDNGEAEFIRQQSKHSPIKTKPYAGMIDETINKTSGMLTQLLNKI